MFYKSTRNSNENVTASKAIVQGISNDGGLYVPSEFPQITFADLKMLSGKSYVEKAVFVLQKFLDDFTVEEIQSCAQKAYAKGKFSSPEIAPLHKIDEHTFALELWHGPTCAFKDMALQILPHLLTTSAKKQGDNKDILILVATSGDTGKAALEGFKDVAGTKVLVFYPQDGVSALQKAQMVTQEGDNEYVCAIAGNFDDAQTGVKNIFADETMKAQLNAANTKFSSANSINWGRLVPQIVYYIASYCKLIADKEIELGEEINVVVPTGNFGNILAAYYSKKMGLPIHKFICASNANKVLTDFIQTGTYNRNRDFYLTSSPSMDILISSNLERLLYLLSDCDDTLINEWFTSLKETGEYTINDTVKQKLQSDFYGGYCDDQQTKKMIGELFQNHQYVCDTHTAVAFHVYKEYVEKSNDHTKTIIASTASPYKFPNSVLEGLGEPLGDNEFDNSKILEKLTKLPIPNGLKNLDNKKIRFTESVPISDMKKIVLEMIK